MTTVHTAHPIVIIGAGPIGLAAAAHLLRKGETPLVVEARANGIEIRDLLLPHKEWRNILLKYPLIRQRLRDFQKDALLTSYTEVQ